MVNDNEHREARGTVRPEARACWGFRPRNRSRRTARDLSLDAGRMRGPLPCRSRSDPRAKAEAARRVSPPAASPLPGMESRTRREVHVTKAARLALLLAEPSLGALDWARLAVTAPLSMRSRTA